MTETGSTNTATAEAEWSGDFTPYLGRWLLHSRKLVDTLDPECTEWVALEGRCEVRPIFYGMGQVELSERFDPAFEGIALRLFDPETGVWRLYWTSSRTPGELGPPVEGRFEDGRGLLLSDEEVGGRRVKVRFEWSGIAEGRPHWEQAFSYDDGKSWYVNWMTDSERVD